MNVDPLQFPSTPSEPAGSGPSMATVFLVSVGVIILVGVVVWAASGTNGDSQSKRTRRKRARRRKQQKNDAAFVDSLKIVPKDKQLSLSQQALDEPDGVNVRSTYETWEARAATNADGAKPVVKVSSLTQAFAPVHTEAEPAITPANLDSSFVVLDQKGFDEQWNSTASVDKTKLSAAALAQRGVMPEPQEMTEPPTRLVGSSSDSFYKALLPTTKRDLNKAEDVPFGGSEFFTTMLARHKDKAA
jgi:hypothetical protein